MNKMPNRHPSHQLSAESKKKFEAVIPSQWVVRELTDDYGIDFEVEVFDEHGNATAEKFYVQLKSTAEKVSSRYLKETIKISTYNYLKKQRYPVLIVKYVKQSDNLYFKWVFEKLSTYPTERSQTVTFHFYENRKFSPESLNDILVDLKNFHQLVERRFSSHLALRLINDGSVVSNAGLIHLQKHQAKTEDWEIEFSDLKYSGQAIIQQDTCTIRLGGGGTSFIFHIDKTMTAENILKKIMFSAGILLSSAGVFQLSGRLLARSYDIPDFFRDSGFVKDVILTLYTSKEYSALPQAYLWMLFNLSPNSEEVKMISFWIFKDYERTSKEEKNLVEDLLISNIISDLITGDKVALGASLYTLGNFYRSIKQWSDSVELLNAARKSASEYLKRDYFWQELGSILYTNEKLNLARKCYENALRLEKSSTLYAFIGDCYLGKGSLDLALKNYEKALKIRKHTEDLDSQYILKVRCLSLIKKSFLEKNRVNKIKIREEKELIEKVHLNVLDSQAWFNLGVYYSKYAHDNLNATITFLWSALLNEGDLEAWVNAFISSFNLIIEAEEAHKEAFVELGTLIITSAYKINRTDFTTELLKFSAQQDKKWSDMMEEVVLGAMDILGIKDNFQYRLIQKDLSINKIEVLKS